MALGNHAKHVYKITANVQLVENREISEVPLPFESFEQFAAKTTELKQLLSEYNMNRLDLCQTLIMDLDLKKGN